MRHPKVLDTVTLPVPYALAGQSLTVVWTVKGKQLELATTAELEACPKHYQQFDGPTITLGPLQYGHTHTFTRAK